MLYYSIFQQLFKFIPGYRFDKVTAAAGTAARGAELTLLSPTIVHKLILGEADLSMQTLRRSFPLVWEKQERELLK